MRLQCGECNSFRDRLHKRETPRLLFLFAPALTAVSTAPVVRSVLAASVSESDQHHKAVPRSSSLQPLLDPSFSFPSAGKKNEKRQKLTQALVGRAARAREKGTSQEVGGEGREDKEPLKASWRGDGEEVLVEIPVIEGLPVGGEGDGKMETAKLWKCNECGGLFKTERGLHVHAALKHRRPHGQPAPPLPEGPPPSGLVAPLQYTQGVLAGVTGDDGSVSPPDAPIPAYLYSS
uniref:C2H2-type domain-containing protein n=1 Tax=Chromera velia CCMP2878 TaxID=1169474 RepID=A0A0K6S729_9ALVE|eukprot:Cvel_18591.t1-p1 / transcript=Cvel_18591.t1 / gene=Cvel_18591 / organism=Chromera_velia_CCMP2878 / gene_product=hypothetical protein / transcript_product=hypothetical protein / location=Cvel_scaffold1551:5349-7972(-) / protein_length=233 / sequence_SO=supercontig / SO=protein_coding / is_pseudo=false